MIEILVVQDLWRSANPNFLLKAELSHCWIASAMALLTLEDCQRCGFETSLCNLSAGLASHGPLSLSQDVVCIPPNETFHFRHFPFQLSQPDTCCNVQVLSDRADRGIFPSAGLHRSPCCKVSLGPVKFHKVLGWGAAFSTTSSNLVSLANLPWMELCQCQDCCYLFGCWALWALVLPSGLLLLFLPASCIKTGREKLKFSLIAALNGWLLWMVQASTQLPSPCRLLNHWISCSGG